MGDVQKNKASPEEDNLESLGKISLSLMAISEYLSAVSAPQKWKILGEFFKLLECKEREKSDIDRGCFFWILQGLKARKEEF